MMDLTKARDLLELIQYQVERHADRVAFSFPREEDKAARELRYHDLERRARRLATGIAARTGPEEPVLLLAAPGPGFIVDLFACLYAGRIAVPAPPPFMDRNIDRLRAIVQDTGARLCLVDAAQKNRCERRFQDDPVLGKLVWCVETELAGPDLARVMIREPNATVLLQYTSGSTGRPRGVRLTGSNLLANARAIHQRFRTDRNAEGVFWLPPYHDMGLLGAVLHPVLIGGRSCLITPLDFLKRPLLWLELISQNKSNISGAPNFAFDLCSDSVTEKEIAALDLSGWRLAFCGAEPVRPATLERFARTFAPAGFRREAFVPCYGLAEATLLVTAGHAGRGPTVRAFERAALQSGRAEVAGPGQWDPGPVELVSCGTPVDQEVRVVDPRTRQILEERRIGEIWVRGPNVAPGLWNDSRAGRSSFLGRTRGQAAGSAFLRTGDLGFFLEGEVFVYARHKEIIPIRGVKIDPVDIEQTALGILANREQRVRRTPRLCAAFARDEAQTTRIYLIAETEQDPGADADELVRLLRTELGARFGFLVDRIALVRAGEIARTTSGKIQRQTTRERFVNEKMRVYFEG